MTERVYALIGETIRRRRDGVGMSQSALGSRIGLSRASVTNIELGRQAVSVHHLYEIADAFGVSVSDLLPEVRPEGRRDPESDASSGRFSELLEKLGKPVVGRIG